MTEEIKHIEEQPKDNCDGCRNKDCLQCPDITELKKKAVIRGNEKFNNRRPHRFSS